MIIPGNKTFGENARRIKDLVKIQDYIASLGIQIEYRNRCECPICKGRKGKMAVNIEKQRVTCFGGCISWGDIIGLHGVLNGLNNFEALNDLIKIYSVNRVMPNNYKPIEEGELQFKAKAMEHLDKCLDELDKISLLKYDLLEQLEAVDYCFNLKELIDTKKTEIKSNRYNKSEIRYLYKKSINFINKIYSININNENI